MTQYEECLHDLEKWDIAYEEGYFYDGDYNNDNEIKVGRWITICGNDGNYLSFDMDGNFQGWW